jgi:hypothetical protein
VTHPDRLKTAPELFEALAQNRPGYVKALLYPNWDDRRNGPLEPFFLGVNYSSKECPAPKPRDWAAMFEMDQASPSGLGMLDALQSLQT